MKYFLEQLKQIVEADRIFIDEPMQKHTTFRVGGPADCLVKASVSEIPKVIALAEKMQVPCTIIGNGSNLLVKDGGIRGVVIEIGASAAELTYVKDGDRHMLIAEAGVMLSALSRAAADRSLAGLAFAAGIPGTVGGAVAMNAGAYGGEIVDVIESATVLMPNGEIAELAKDELDLSYRHSVILDRGYVVLSAKFLLQEGDAEEIRTMMSDFTNRRIEKQPLEYPSAGSTFKRPVGYFAGKLIEDSGLRGYRVGDAQVSEKHCGFVVNRGAATATDLLQLMQDVRDKVYADAGVELEPEVRILGEDA